MAEGFEGDLQRLQERIGRVPPPRRSSSAGSSGTESEDDAGRDILWAQRHAVAKLLARQNVPFVVESLTENEHSRPGCPLYEAFLGAWCDVPDKTVRLVFHGTAEANVEADTLWDMAGAEGSKSSKGRR